MRSLYKTFFLILFASLIYAQNNPGPRYGHTMVSYGGKIYLFGGAGTQPLGKTKANKKESFELRDVWAYRDSDRVWRNETPVVSPRPRKRHSAVVWNNKMIVYGGECSGSLLNDLWSYDFSTKTWTEMVVGGTPPPVASHSAVVEDDKLIIAGGLDLQGGSRDSMNEIDLNHTELGFRNSVKLPEPLHSGAIINVNNSLYYIYGIWSDYDPSTPGNQPSYSSSVFSLADGASSWTVSSTPGYAREASKFAGVYVPGKNTYYMFGGEKFNYSTNQPENLNEAAQIAFPCLTSTGLDGDTVEVNRCKESAAVLDTGANSSSQMMKKYLTSSSANEVIYVYGGINSSGIISSSLYKFNPNGNTYLKLNSIIAPTGLTSVASSSSQVNLTWNDNSANETGFVIERKTNQGLFEVIYSTAQNIISYSDNTILDGNNYTYRVTAFNNTGAYSDCTNESLVVIPLNPPSNLTSGVVNTALQLIWSDNSQNEIGYTIDKKVGTGQYAKLIDLPANSVTYTDTDVTSGMNYYYKVKAFNSITVSGYSNEATSILVGIQDKLPLPTEFSLIQNYPNPFNPTTKIKFSLPERATVKLTVYDLCGREVAMLVNSELSAGFHEIEFNAGNLTSGIYYYRLQADNYSSVKKLVLIK